MRVFRKVEKEDKDILYQDKQEEDSRGKRKKSQEESGLVLSKVKRGR
jgi:hypothetical protein